MNIGVGSDRFVVGPWQGDPSAAYLSTRTDNQVDPRNLRVCLQRLRDAGYVWVITPAMHPEEAVAFFANGFSEYDSLAVLGHELEPLPEPTVCLPDGLTLRRGRRSDLADLFDLDGRAFPSNWRMDMRGLREARKATVRNRFRVVEHRPGDGEGPRVVGYAITGRTRSMGFLQRLATDPHWNGRGIGSSLVTDALRWARSGGCSQLLVNTQQTNRRALSLYENLGFVRTVTRLIVLRCYL